MIRVKPLQEFHLASDFVSPLTGKKFPKEVSSVAINTAFNSKNLGDFHYVKPNPVFLYLRLTEDFLDRRTRLLKNPQRLDMPFLGPSDQKPKNEYDHNYMFDLLQVTVGGVVMLFSGLEAFINQQIPAGVEYTRKGKPTEKYNHQGVQRRIGTREKMARVLVLFLKRDIRTEKALWKGFLEFEELRHEFVHLKMPHDKIYVNTYDKLFNDLVDVDLKKYLEIAKKIMNFYIPDFIEEGK